MMYRCSECDKPLTNLPRSARTCSKSCKMARTRKRRRELYLEDKLRRQDDKTIR